jgi:two-component system, OmpR family, sensor histidine kinase QseC
MNLSISEAGRTTLGRTLFIRIAPTIIVTILLIGAFAFRSATHEIDTVYDAQLISNANVLWSLIGDELEEGELTAPKQVDDIDLKRANQEAINDSADDYADSRMFRVWKDGNILMYSDTALPATVNRQNDGFSIVKIGEDKWRIYTLPIHEAGITIEVGEKVTLRDTLVANILLNLAVPLLLLIPLVGVLIWVGIGSGLGTIRSLIDQIRARSPDDMSQINPELLPRDLVPLVKSINQLFIKIEDSFTAEKRFTDHAAHQLRTPQATMKLQLQMLAEASGEEEKRALIADLIRTNERGSKLVGMLLTSARLHHQSIKLQPVSAYRAIASVMAELGVLANEKSIELSLAGDETLHVLADETLLKLMMSNLIENAIKYTPEHGEVRVRIYQESLRAVLSIIDTGCGIANNERALVFERFYRAQTPEAEGSGLGLTIVKEIVDHFSGEIALSSPATGVGLQIDVRLRLA